MGNVHSLIFIVRFFSESSNELGPTEKDWDDWVTLWCERSVIDQRFPPLPYRETFIAQ